MSSSTTNLGLSKPELTDPINPAMFATDFELIDASIGALQESMGSLAPSMTQLGTLTWNNSGTYNQILTLSDFITNYKEIVITWVGGYSGYSNAFKMGFIPSTSPTSVEINDGYFVTLPTATSSSTPNDYIVGVEFDASKMILSTTFGSGNNSQAGGYGTSLLNGFAQSIYGGTTRTFDQDKYKMQYMYIYMPYGQIGQVTVTVYGLK